MNGEERVYSVLVVSCAEKYNTALLDMLPGSKYGPVKVASSVSEAKRAFSEYAYDFIIINSPLPDDPGTRFAADCCRSGGSVALLLLKSDVLEQTYFRAVSHGVFTLRKPTSKTTVLLALDWMTAARERLRVLEDKGRSVEERMEEIRTVNRAKLLLISELKMTEPEAHRYIEKKAMDACISKSAAARGIIAMYS